MRSRITPKTLEERLWSDIMTEPNTGCWLWVGHLNCERGYGRFIYKGRKSLSHRASYELYVGPIPKDMTLHHTCNVPCCVNPKHLIPMSRRENTFIRLSGALPTTYISTLDRRSIGIGRKAILQSRIKVSETGCWIWQGATNTRYGVWSRNGKIAYAHRESFRLFKGEIPKGMTIDHLCKTPLCVNPEHLECVTELENHRREKARRLVCKRGHPFDTENTWIEKNGARHCRKCHAINESKKRNRQNAQEHLQAAGILGIG